MIQYYIGENKMKEEIVKSMIQHAEGQIAKHKMNVEIFLQKSVGVGEHNDILETIEKEVNAIGKYEEQIDVLKKHFIN
tara:strand:+ start:614 stop:847 length:234 start_codon:yes stop_codon:yes gene_type:complete